MLIDRKKVATILELKTQDKYSM